MKNMKEGVVIVTVIRRKTKRKKKLQQSLKRKFCQVQAVQKRERKINNSSSFSEKSCEQTNPTKSQVIVKNIKNNSISKKKKKKILNSSSSSSIKVSKKKSLVLKKQGKKKSSSSYSYSSSEPKKKLKKKNESSYYSSSNSNHKKKKKLKHKKKSSSISSSISYSSSSSSSNKNKASIHKKKNGTGKVGLIKKKKIKGKKKSLQPSPLLTSSSEDDSFNSLSLKGKKKKYKMIDIESDLDASKPIYHIMLCNSQREELQRFSELMSITHGRQCPQCGIYGVNGEDECNHMVCEKCHTEWCYFCGKDKNEIKWDKKKNFYSHFDHWTVDKDKCPMYMFMIGFYAKEWPKNPQGSLDFFHKKLVLKAIYKFVNNVGVDRFK